MQAQTGSEWLNRIEEARHRIYALAIETPLTRADDARFGDAQIFLKREDLQNTGSFKLRGAANKVLGLSSEIAARGVVTSSTGNHGLGVAAAGKHRGINVEIFLPAHVSPWKLQRIEALGAHIQKVQGTSVEAELAAREAAEHSGRSYIPPYNDPTIIAGQGTVAVELHSELTRIDAIYVAVGGGGLISGIGLYCREMMPHTEIIACWADNSHVMYDCLLAGEIREFPELPTVSEGTAGGVEPDSMTLDLCRRVIDRHVFASEEEILDSMRWAQVRGWMMEGAAGIAIAAAFKDAHRIQGKTAAVVACGANASPEVLAQL